MNIGSKTLHNFLCCMMLCYIAIKKEISNYIYYCKTNQLGYNEFAFKNINSLLVCRPDLCMSRKMDK